MPLSAHEFERRLIFYASPTLTKLKVACIYNLNDLDDLEECIQYYNELLNKKDIYLKVLKIKGRSMIYVYQKEKLNKLCACKQIQNIFKKYNYNCTSLDTLILDLQKRLNDYDFPHEIGLFLGKFIVMLKIVSIHLINIINVHMNYVKDLIKEKVLSKYADMSNW